MTGKKLYMAIGLMSGTSMDGIDAALIQTDGEGYVVPGPALTRPYDAAFKARLAAQLGPGGRARPGRADLERDLTAHHADAVEALLKTAEMYAEEIDIIGFHGHTLHHDPKNRETLQIGDGQALADRLGVPVAFDFRTDDVAQGGQGAPLVPVFHAALARSADKVTLPVAVLNIGGVANVTWVGQGDEDILAFDTGPGNAGLNDWMRDLTGQDMDQDGLTAAKGFADDAIVGAFLDDPYFAVKPPKSLDRQALRLKGIESLSLEDGAATWTAAIVRSIARASEHFPSPASTWIVTGGGRRNPEIMKGLATALGVPVLDADNLGWDGDALEAQAFAYLAVRTLKGLPISFPSTTGAPEPLVGGRVVQPS